MKFIKLPIVLIFILFAENTFAEDTSSAKKNFFSRFTDSISGSLKNLIRGDSSGDTEVQINAGEDYHPTFSIMTVKPLATHPGVDAWFVQFQLNEQKVRGSGRLSTNLGLGYRQLSDSKNAMTGANLFLDYDAEGNARGSIGLELRTTAFEAIANYYSALSSGITVGSYTERTLDGIEVSLVGEIPYFPWASIIVNSYEWQAEKNSKNSNGEKYSLELTLTQNFILEGGAEDNNIDGSANFIKAYFVFPPRDRISATTNFIGESAFSQGNMSGELLSKIRRINNQVIESEGSGVVMARSN